MTEYPDIAADDESPAPKHPPCGRDLAGAEEFLLAASRYTANGARRPSSGCAPRSLELRKFDAYCVYCQQDRPFQHIKPGSRGMSRRARGASQRISCGCIRLPWRTPTINTDFTFISRVPALAQRPTLLEKVGRSFLPSPICTGSRPKEIPRRALEAGCWRGAGARRRPRCSHGVGNRLVCVRTASHLRNTGG